MSAPTHDPLAALATALPPPTAEHLTRTGLWPRSHMNALRRELDELCADLDPKRLPSGSSLVPDDIAPLIYGRVRVMVGVYAPGGMDAHSLGWMPLTDVDQATARILTHLPGARVEQERPRETHPQAVMIQWGSRTPGWTPTTVWVTRTMTGIWREPDTIWTATQVAEHLGITESTWRAYTVRGDAGAPSELGTIRVRRGPRDYPVGVWDRQTVIDWHASRPGKGGRPRAGDPR